MACGPCCGHDGNVSMQNIRALLRNFGFFDSRLPLRKSFDCSGLRDSVLHGQNQSRNWIAILLKLVSTTSAGPSFPGARDRLQVVSMRSQFALPKQEGEG